MTFAGLLNRFESLRAIVVGDVMLDEYVMTRATRISPEAPVMVVQERSRRAVPGGAANVARNIAALGAKATILGVVGNDEGGATLESALRSDDLECTLIKVPSRMTTVKTRIVADHAHQVLRIDREITDDIDEDTGRELCRLVEGQLQNSQVLLLSDYRKGTLSAQIIVKLLTMAKEHDVPVVANAKPDSTAMYSGAALVTLNRSEASKYLVEEVTQESAPDQARRIAQSCGCKSVAITLGEAGVAIGSDNQSFHVAAPKVEAYDVAGAGDTAVACMALGMAAVGLQRPVFELAVEVAAKVIQHVGVAVPSQSDIEAFKTR